MPGALEHAKDVKKQKKKKMNFRHVFCGATWMGALGGALTCGRLDSGKAVKMLITAPRMDISLPRLQSYNKRQSAHFVLWPYLGYTYK